MENGIQYIIEAEFCQDSDQVKIQNDRFEASLKARSSDQSKRWKSVKELAH